MFHWMGGTFARDNFPGLPMVDPLAGPPAASVCAPAATETVTTPAWPGQAEHPRNPETAKECDDDESGVVREHADDGGAGDGDQAPEKAKWAEHGMPPILVWFASAHQRAQRL